MDDNNLRLLRQIFTEISNAADPSEGYIALDLCFMSNPDGSLRWIWPRHLEQPLFLKFYNTSNSRARRIATGIRIAYKMKMLRPLVFGSLNMNVRRSAVSVIEKQLGRDWCLFSGTAGANRTAILHGNGKFIKVPLGPNAPASLDKEFRMLRKAAGYKLDHIKLPFAERIGHLLLCPDVSGCGRQTTALKDIHFNALRELSLINRMPLRLGDTAAWQETTRKLTRLESLRDFAVPTGLVQALKLLKDGIDENKAVVHHFSHGDFTPWNIFSGDDALAVIDWELANDQRPALYDAIHFIYQQASLVDRVPYKVIRTRVDALMQKEICTSYSRQELECLHALYILYTAVFYLDAFTIQKERSPQENWSMDTWMAAACDILANRLPMRSLFLSELFHRLRNTRYAWMKSQNRTAFDVPEDADLDLCLDDHITLERFVRDHTFTTHVKTSKRSFMTNYGNLLRDNSFVSIDAISSFKRREMVMLEADAVLASSVTDEQGIKRPAKRSDALYMTRFYTLNRAEIPARYLAITGPAPSRSKVLAEIRAEGLNRGWSGWKQIINYIIDSARSLVPSRGFIITFSGVDGAGKSTVIGQVHKLIEKKYRRKVVVLRHRPAVLPMLTAWKKGRKAAELQAAERLPRQGNNKNMLSSLLRFGYYYLDYLLGQVVVQVRYVWRGYVVLYDRYYFDFINDGRRSNISLPSWFVGLGYHLLLKPSYNFFLYADPETIVARKQELDKDTIRELTDKYMKLFSQYSARFSNSSYIPLRNETLADTSAIIMRTIQNRSI